MDTLSPYPGAECLVLLFWCECYISMRSNNKATSFLEGKVNHAVKGAHEFRGGKVPVEFRFIGDSDFFFFFAIFSVLYWVFKKSF